MNETSAPDSTEAGDTATCSTAANDAQLDETDPYRPLDWRLQEAVRLGTAPGDQPPSHDDPWVESTAELFYRSQNKDDTWLPAAQQFQIGEAIRLHSTGSLVKSVLEARLVSGQSPAEISGRCRFDQQLIEAYRVVVFDVEGRRGRGAWLGSPLPVDTSETLMTLRLGEWLKSFAFFDGAELLERMIQTLCRLGGRSLADGLPEGDGIHFQVELTGRFMLAQALLPSNRVIYKEYERCGHALAQYNSRGFVSTDTLGQIRTLLGKIRVTEALQQQIEVLRQNSRSAATDDVAQSRNQRDVIGSA